jgi:hypothetical protein
MNLDASKSIFALFGIRVLFEVILHDEILFLYDEVALTLLRVMLKVAHIVFRQLPPRSSFIFHSLLLFILISYLIAIGVSAMFD